MSAPDESGPLSAGQVDLYREVFLNTPIGIYRSTPEGQILMANPAFTRMLGCASYQELASRNLEDEFGSLYSRKQFKERLEREGTLQGMESQWLRSDGAVVYVRESAKVVRGPGGEARYYEGTIEDISDRVRAEQRLGLSEALKETILETGLDAIVAMDQRGQMVEFNRAAERMFGYQRADVIGADMADLIIPPRLRDAHRAGLAHLLATGEGPILGRRVEIHAIRRDGSEFPVELDIERVAIGDGSVMFVGHIRDISEHKRAEAVLDAKNKELAAALAAAREATELKGQFLANMSHEIRTPMNGVIGMVDMLLDSPLTPEQREFAEIVRDSSQSLLTIINDILDLSKIEAGRLTIESIDVDLPSLVRGVYASLSDAAGKKGLDSTYLLPERLPSPLYGDPTRLRQVLVNLVSNAIKFTEHGSIVLRVAVEAEAEGTATIRCAVTDTGIGIAEEALGRIWESFAQADGSVTRRYGGTGLGLSISRQLIERMGGRVGVQSELGKGSTFWFVLPFETRARPWQD